MGGRKAEEVGQRRGISGEAEAEAQDAGALREEFAGEDAAAAGGGDGVTETEDEDGTASSVAR